MRNNERMNGYKIDFTKNTITMNYTFAKSANEYGSAEYELLTKVLADFPTMKVIVKSGRVQKTARKNKGLTYKNMESHIRAYSNSDELLKMFDKVIEMSATAKSPYKYVRDWFEAQFPNYKDIPQFDKNSDGKMIVIPIEPKEVEEKATA